MASKRLYYAIKQVGLKPDGDLGDYDVIYGVQDASISSNYNLTPIFEFGQLETYVEIEEIPEISISVNKVIDGHPLIWHLATQNAPEPTLIGRSNEKANFALATFPDTQEQASGTPSAVTECSGTYAQSLSYTFGLDGAFNEAVTFVANDKISSSDYKILNTGAQSRADAIAEPGYFNGVFNSIHSPIQVERREQIEFATHLNTADVNGMNASYDTTILPPEVDGISSSGTNDIDGDGQFTCHVQNISISTDLGRESINELGRRLPFHRYPTTPVEVTTSIEALALSGDGNSATEEGIYSTGTGCSAYKGNLKDRTIRVATRCGLRIYLGTKNRLQSIEFGGGSTDGGNDTNTYNFRNFNKMTVMASYDPSTGASGWWTARATHLSDV